MFGLLHCNFLVTYSHFIVIVVIIIIIYTDSLFSSSVTDHRPFRGHFNVHLVSGKWYLYPGCGIYSRPGLYLRPVYRLDGPYSGVLGSKTNHVRVRQYVTNQEDKRDIVGWKAVKSRAGVAWRMMRWQKIDEIARSEVQSGLGAWTDHSGQTAVSFWKSSRASRQPPAPAVINTLPTGTCGMRRQSVRWCFIRRRPQQRYFNPSQCHGNHSSSRNGVDRRRPMRSAEVTTYASRH